MKRYEKLQLPINEKPSLVTCIHYAYPCAIIESKELAIIEINNYEQEIWNYETSNTSVCIEEETIKILEDSSEITTDTVIWRCCKDNDELILNIGYEKENDFSRYIDIFLFTDDLHSELKREDKSCGLRCNPYGYFIEKQMYFFDTKLYRYMKINITEDDMICYTSSDGIVWNMIDHIEYKPTFPLEQLKIGIHIHNGTNQYNIWKKMNFTQLVYNENNIYKGIWLDYYLIPTKNYDNGYSCYMNFLDTYYDLLSDALDCFSTIHEYIQWNIRHFYYVSILLDEYYIKNRKAYQTCHYQHANMFYGFDNTEKVYYIMGIGKNSTPVIDKLPYDVLEKNIVLSENIIRYKYSTNKVGRLTFNIKILINSLWEFLFDINSSERVGNLLEGENVYYGISILQRLVNTEIGQDHLLEDKRIAFLLYEHCLLMRQRLDFLHSNQYLNKKDYIELLEKCNEMIKTSNILLNLVLKYIRKPQNARRIFSTLLELYDMEKAFCERFLLCLTSYSKEIKKWFQERYI